jgi:hypothetical protein
MSPKLSWNETSLFDVIRPNQNRLSRDQKGVNDSAHSFQRSARHCIVNDLLTWNDSSFCFWWRKRRRMFCAEQPKKCRRHSSQKRRCRVAATSAQCSCLLTTSTRAIHARPRGRACRRGDVDTALLPYLVSPAWNCCRHHMSG